MTAYQLYIQDDRYSVPTLCFIEAKHDAHAISQARGKLAGNPHHKGVEIRCGDLYVGGLGVASPDHPSHPLYGRLAAD